MILLGCDHIKVRSKLRTSVFRTQFRIYIGIAGQDGYFLSNFLYEKGYKIHGIDCKHPSDLKQKVKSISWKPVRGLGQSDCRARW